MMRYNTIRTYIYRYLIGILTLSIISSCPSSLCADIYADTNIAGAMRAPATANQDLLPRDIFKGAPPVGQEFLVPEEGANDAVIATEGVVAHIDSDGKVILIGAGTKLLPGARLPVRLTEKEVTELQKTNREFSGNPIDTVEGQFRLLHMLDQELVESILRKESLYENVYIKFDVEFLPDFPLDGNRQRLVEAVLNTLAMRLLQYKILFHDKIRIDFVSTAGKIEKVESVKKIFSNMDLVRKQLDKIIYAAPQGTDASRILLITHKGADIERLKKAEQLKYTVLYLEQTLMIDEETMGAWPLHTVMDLAASVLVIKSLQPERQKEFFHLIKNIFERLVGHEIDDELLNRYLGPDVTDAEKAALALALPPVEKLNLEKSIGRLINIMAEVAKYA